MPEFVEHALEVIDSIPAGRVMTYGGVAAAIGSRAPRAVGQVMSKYGSDVAWWRVVHAGGLPPKCHEETALQFYQAEETPLVWLRNGNYRVDVDAARFDG